MKNPQNPSVCLICLFGYYPEGNRCAKVSDLCRDHNVQNGQCTSCISPIMLLTNGQCRDPNCMNYNGDICDRCVQNFVYNVGQKICQFSDQNCMNPGPAQCLQCRQGFYVSSSGICMQLPANCRSARPNGVCSECNQGYQVMNQVCMRLPPNCRVLGPNGICLDCIGGY